MKLVTFASDMAPYRAGDTRLVPDEVADDLELLEVLSAAVPWPPEGDAMQPQSAAPVKPKRPQLKPARPTGGAAPRIAR